MLRTERHDAIAVWTIDRPDVKNALDAATMKALADIAREAESDGSLRAAILTGAGDTFVSGGDLRELRGRHSPAEAEVLSDAGFELCRALVDLPFPVLCALEGPAIGGGAELAVACDLRVAAPAAKIAFKQVRMGVVTAWGSAARLVALVGPSAAARLLYTAAEIPAADALRLGLVDAVADAGTTARDVALGWAKEIAAGPPKAIAAMKTLLRETAGAAAGDVRALERRLFVETWSSPDHVEAIEAYFERRRPKWLDR